MRGIRWTLTSLLDDLDYADDIALLSHRHQDMQAKIDDMTRKAGEIGLKISTKKTKHLRMNKQNRSSHHGSFDRRNLEDCSTLIRNNFAIE
ncbi:hypothetical protein LSAT2_014268 [Lamellibrachia satsuma]|nr:hypothetical protein LSAT2_014268 [Lamellibrachia satsuma]